jgi:hypothetical protein
MALRKTPITFRTLADLVQHGYGLNAHCEACGHRRDLNLDDLVRRLGADFDVIGETLEPLLRCTECDARGKATVKLHLLNTNKSRFAD